MRYAICLLFIFTLSSFAPKKPGAFPNFSISNQHGVLFSNENLKGKNTLLVHFHLGCPAAMMLLKDLEEIKKMNPNFQIIAIAENTPDQVEAYLKGEERKYKALIKFFAMPEITTDILAECNEPLRHADSSNTTGYGCNGLSKELKIYASPTYYFIGPDGTIISEKKGYFWYDTKRSQQDRIKKWWKGVPKSWRSHS